MCFSTTFHSFECGFLANIIAAIGGVVVVHIVAVIVLTHLFTRHNSIRACGCVRAIDGVVVVPIVAVIVLTHLFTRHIVYEHVDVCVCVSLSLSVSVLRLDSWCS